MGVPSKLEWLRVRGEDLVEGYESGSLADLLPERSAIYLWKRNLRCTSNEMATAESMTAWLARQVQTANGRVDGSRVSHFAYVKEFELRPGELKEERQKLFMDYFKRRNSRRYMARYMKEVATHLPALYVGESGNLLRRVAQHIHGDSQFGTTITEHSDLSWIDLDLFYWELDEADDNDNELRKAIELVTTAVTIGGFTRRPG